MDESLTWLRSMLEIALPPDEAREIVESVQGGLSNFFAAPRTTKARLQDEIQGRLERLPPEELQARIVPRMGAFFKLYQDFGVRSIQQNFDRISKDPVALDLLQFELASAEVLGDQRTLEMVRQLQQSISITNLVESVGALSTLGSGEQGSLPFETRAVALSNCLASVAESWYKPLLQFLLRLSRAVVSVDSAVPNELGAVMGQCRELWASSMRELLPLLDDRLRIIRNSEAHRHTRIDPRANTIAWVNARRDGTQEVLGPVGSDALGTLVQRTSALLINMNTVHDLLERRVKLNLGVPW